MYHLSIYLSICLSVRLSVCLSVCLSIYLSIYLKDALKDNARNFWVTQPLICFGWSVHYWVSCTINKGGFLRLHLCQHTFAPLWDDCLRFASFWRAKSRGDSCVLGVHLPNVCCGVLFVFVTRSYFKFAEGIDLCLLNLPKRSTPWVKF